MRLRGIAVLGAVLAVGLSGVSPVWAFSQKPRVEVQSVSVANDHKEALMQLRDLATADLRDITAAAAARGIKPTDLAISGGGKRTQPNKILAISTSPSKAAFFVGRIADDAPDGAASWAAYCLDPAQDVRMAEIGGTRPSALRGMAAELCN